MTLHRVNNLVFSSSATIYGDAHIVSIKESFPLSPINPYGQTKLMSEQILRDLERSDDDWRVAYLRYFNPVGAHESGLIGVLLTLLMNCANIHSCVILGKLLVWYSSSPFL